MQRATRNQMLKADRDTLERALVHAFDKVGERLEFYGEWVLQTSVGSLNVRVDKGAIFSVFMRFGNDVDHLDLYRLGANNYSGKWNQYFGRRSAAEAYEQIQRHLEWVGVAIPDYNVAKLTPRKTETA